VFAGKEPGHTAATYAVGCDDHGIGAELIVDAPQQGGQVRP